MKQVVIAIACLNMYACLNAQGITLLYNTDMGWNDPLSWIQINTPVGQTAIQRVPTELDDVVISNSLSGLSTVGFLSDIVNPEFFVGSNNTSGYRCKSMHISNTMVTFDSPNDIDAAARINIYTSNSGFALVDSGSDIIRGQFYLNGGNPAITDLEVINRNFGVLFSHGDWCDILWQPSAKVRVTGSTLGGHSFASSSTGGEMYASNCTFSTNNFILGDNSTDTILNSTITNDINNLGFNFFIGRNANFVSANVSLEPFEGFNFTSSGSVLNGNVTTITGYAGGGGPNFLQEDPANPLPNIINGNVSVGEVSTIGISGDLKISGNLSGFSDDFYNNPAQVFVNGQDIFEVAGITNYQGNVSINNCLQDYCHYKLEFFGSTNSNIDWYGGFPVDTLIINKTGCAKVTCTNSLYVSGATRIESGQLVLNPNDTIAYKFVCAGNVDIAQGGGLFLRKDADGITANMAIGGTLTDHNPAVDSTCAGLSNPYDGIITFYTAALPVTLLDFYGRYSSNSVVLSWSTEREINTKYFTIEKSVDGTSFVSLANIAASGNTQSKKAYGYTDNTFLKGINYYRLKMVDADGRFTYSKIIAIAAPAINAITVFPNPVKDKLFIRLAGVPAATGITIADAKGTIVKQLHLKAGSTDASVNTMGLPAGVYSISIQSGKLKNTQQFIKE